MGHPTEAEVQRDILLIAPVHGARLLRNNSGMLQDRTGRWVAYGLGNSGSKKDTSAGDLIGWTDVEGRAVFTSVECKRRGEKPTEKQVAWCSAIQKQGGIGVIAYSVDDFVDAVNKYRAAHVVNA